jgi:folate-binding protein YgfZ
MHDNSAPDFALPDHRVISIVGRDAVAFAQAQFMNDVNAIASGQWQWNGWLTPKGRVIALFALLRIDDETVWLLLPDSNPATMLTALQRFVFRSKVTMAVRADLKVSGAFAAPDTVSGAQFGLSGSESVELDMGGDGGPRRLRIGIDESAAEENLLARWDAFDLRHGLPRLPASQAEQWTPQQLSLERLQGFSVKKGCYPGQEIVARTHFLGKAKRGLALLEGTAPIAVGSEVRSDDAALGTTVSSGADGQWLALAVLPLDRIEQPLTVDGQAVSERPLLDGLAR